MSSNNDGDEKRYWKMTDEEYNQHYRNASGAYYLLPIFLTWIGSIIMYLKLKDEDPKKAKKGAILGIVLTIALPVAGILIFTGLATHGQALIEEQREQARFEMNAERERLQEQMAQGNETASEEYFTTDWDWELLLGEIRS